MSNYLIQGFTIGGFCACPKSGPGFYILYAMVLFMFNLALRGRGHWIFFVSV